MPAVLVTGAYGFLASHVIQQLLAAGHVVRGSVRNASDEERLKLLHALCPDGARDKLEVVEADLLQPDDWLPAVEGMDYVIHTACPWPNAPPKCDDDQIKPAVEGTLNVLKACAKVSSVRRVVYTSSTFAVQLSTSPDKRSFSEDDWNDSNLETADSLGQCKLLAERAAWDFVENLPEDQKFELAVVNPATTFGPMLNHSESCSVSIMRTWLEHTAPMIPKYSIAVADVRDVAAAHVKTMTLPEAAGKRHIVYSGNIWMSEIGTLLNDVFKPLGYKIATVTCPSIVLKAASFLDPMLKAIIPYLEVVHKFDSTREHRERFTERIHYHSMREVLGIEPINMRDSLVDMAHSMVQLGIVPKTDKYSPTRDPAVRERYLSMQL